MRLAAIERLPACAERNGRVDPAELVAVGRFELDHVGAEIGEQPRRVRARVVRAEVEDAQPVEQRARGSGAGAGRRGRRGPSAREHVGGVVVPTTGAGPGTVAGVDGELGGGATWSTRPSTGSSTSTTISLCSDLGLVEDLAGSEVLGIAHTSAARSASSHSARGRGREDRREARR